MVYDEFFNLDYGHLSRNKLQDKRFFVYVNKDLYDNPYSQKTFISDDIYQTYNIPTLTAAFFSKNESKNLDITIIDKKTNSSHIFSKTRTINEFIKNFDLDITKREVKNKKNNMIRKHNNIIKKISIKKDSKNINLSRYYFKERLNFDIKGLMIELFKKGNWHIQCDMLKINLRKNGIIPRNILLKVSNYLFENGITSISYKNRKSLINAISNYKNRKSIKGNKIKYINLKLTENNSLNDNDITQDY
ncbi:hypothetical protein ACFL56_00880 [Candidatus Margulisiibacteriota bacterium]